MIHNTVVVDFDNTLAGYDKWRGEDVFGPPVPYAMDAMKEYWEWGWRCVVFTTRGNVPAVEQWLRDNRFPFHPLVNSTSHNPPNTSGKPIADVYHEDRDAHVVGTQPYNWHRAMARVRQLYQPKVDSYVDDAAAWSSWFERYVVAPRRRREFAQGLDAWFEGKKISNRLARLKEAS